MGCKLVRRGRRTWSENAYERTEYGYLALQEGRERPRAGHPKRLVDCVVQLVALPSDCTQGVKVVVEACIRMVSALSIAQSRFGALTSHADHVKGCFVQPIEGIDAGPAVASR